MRPGVGWPARVPTEPALASSGVGSVIDRRTPRYKAGAFSYVLYSGLGLHSMCVQHLRHEYLGVRSVGGRIRPCRLSPYALHRVLVQYAW